MNCLTKAASSHPSKKQLDRLTKVREYSTAAEVREYQKYRDQGERVHYNGEVERVQ